MEPRHPPRIFIAEALALRDTPVTLRGWIRRLRVHAQSAFVVLGDCSGELQCVVASSRLKDVHLKVEDTVELRGRVVAEPRAPAGCELVVDACTVLNPAANVLPFQSAADLARQSAETLIDYRPLAVRNRDVGVAFHVQMALLRAFRDFLTAHRFTEIITSKLVASGTEGGTNLFPVSYFERSAYLAQSPQFYKEHGVCGFERVFETGHVYRAEPHASSRHLTEYYSLDVEMGFIDGIETVIDLERELLDAMFERVLEGHRETVASRRGMPLPRFAKAPVWAFDDCLARLARTHRRHDLIDDLDPLAERQLCAMAAAECGTAALFVVGFPASARPFYSAPRGTSGAAESFDLLFDGIEITTGGVRLHRRADLEAAMVARGLDPAGFASHLRMFDLGMPPHGGFAIGLERLTAQLLGLPNVRQAVLYPRDRDRLEP